MVLNLWALPYIPFTKINSIIFLKLPKFHFLDNGYFRFYQVTIHWDYCIVASNVKGQMEHLALGCTQPLLIWTLLCLTLIFKHIGILLWLGCVSESVDGSHKASARAKEPVGGSARIHTAPGSQGHRRPFLGRLPFITQTRSLGLHFPALWFS